MRGILVQHKIGDSVGRIIALLLQRNQIIQRGNIDMRIINNLLPKTYQDEIEKTITSRNFSWGYSPVTSYTGTSTSCTDDKTLDCPQLSHAFLSKNKMTSMHWNLVYPVVLFLEKEMNTSFVPKLNRIKVNLMWNQPNYPAGFYNVPHADGMRVNTLLYYVNDSDGDTVIFNESVNEVNHNQPASGNNLTIKHRQSPKKGRCLFFDSSLMHASIPPVKHDTRIVINFVFDK